MTFSPAQSARSLVATMERMAGELETLQQGYPESLPVVAVIKLRDRLDELAKVAHKEIAG